MPDVLLIQPPIRDFYLTAKRTIPYGLACIASALEAEGFSVEILDCLATSKPRPIDLPPEMEYLRDYYGKPDISPFGLFHHFRHYGYSFQHVGAVVKKAAPFIVGVSSLFTAYADEALAVAEAAKAAHPGCRVVMGGHHPTEMPEAVMRCGAVDYVIRGEGEAAMPRLVRALMDGTGVRSVLGIVARTPDGGIIVAPPAISADLDRNPLPAMHLVNRRFYRRGPKGSAVITASRGCPLRCSYCSVGGSAYLTYRRRSVRSVLCEIKEAVRKFGAGFIDFEDENISLDKPWFMELLGGIIERFGEGAIELRAMNGLFPPSLDEEMVDAMKRAGFTALNLSLGTTCRGQLERFRRPDVREAFDRAVSWAGKYGLSAVGYIIVGAPGQSALDSVSDLLYLAGCRAIAGVSVFYPSPGSADFNRCAESNLLPAAFSLMRATALPISDTTTREESVTLLRLGRILNFMKSLREGHGPSHGEDASGGEFAGSFGLDRDLSAGHFQSRQMADESLTNRKLTAPQSRGRDPLDRHLAGLHSPDGHLPGLDTSESFPNRQDRWPLPARLPECPSPAAPEAANRPPDLLGSARPTGTGPAGADRIEAGKALLEMFLEDGKIRGMTPDGEVYEHRASHALCRAFIEGLFKDPQNR